MAQISGSDLASVKVGDAAEVETGVDAGRFSGTVDNIAALVNPDTRSVIARVVVDNPGDLLKKQMYVRVLIQSRQESSGPAGPGLGDPARRREPALRLSSPSPTAASRGGM